MKLLIIKPSSLGDVIHALQVVAAIKFHRPEITVDWVIRDCFAEIVEASGLVDKVLLFHRGAGLWKFINLLRDIRQKEYDYVFDMQGLARSGIMATVAKCKNKIGRPDAREFSGMAYDQVVKIPHGKSTHAIEILLQFLPILSLPARLDGRLNFITSPKENIQQMVASENFRGNYIIVFPESRRKEKEWPYFSDLIAKLAIVCPKRGIVISGQKKFNYFENNTNVINLSSQTSLTDVTFLIKHAKFVISNDSAPMHLAAAMNTSVLALFGPTDPQKFGPYPMSSPQNRVIQSPNNNIHNIALSDVISAAEEMINR